MLIPLVTEEIVREHDFNDSFLMSQMKADVLRFRDISGDRLWMSGGIGDVLAMRSFMTDEEAANVAVIYFLGYRPKVVEPFVRWCFPNLRHYLSYWLCLGSKYRSLHFQKQYEFMLGQDSALKNCLVRPFFDSIKRRERVYHHPSFLSLSLADVVGFNLPSQYIVLAPDSVNATKGFEHRTLSENDWQPVLDCLQSRQIKGVAIGAGRITVPTSDWVVDLTNQTTVMEALEITRTCSGYIGIDTAFCVLAAKVLPSESICIRSKSSHCYGHLYQYFAPHRKFDFVNRQVVLDGFQIYPGRI